MKVVHFSPEVMKRLHPLLSPYIARETENFWFGRRTYVYNAVSAFFKHGCPLINSAVVGATRVVLVGSRWSDASPLLVPRLEASTSSLHSRDCLVKTRSRFACLTSVSSSSYFTNTAFFGRFSCTSQRNAYLAFTRIPPSQCFKMIGSNIFKEISTKSPKLQSVKNVMRLSASFFMTVTQKSRQNETT